LNALPSHNQLPRPNATDCVSETEAILDFRVNYLAHNSMSRVCSDVKRRCLDVTLIRERPLVVLGRQLAYGILIFCSRDDGLEGIEAILGLGCPGNARNPLHDQFEPRMGVIRSLCPLPHCLCCAINQPGRLRLPDGPVIHLSSEENTAGFTVQICNQAQ